jgi:hypothetical protein
MPTLRELVDEITSTLTGYTTDLPMRGTLVNSVSDTDVSFTIQFPVPEQSPVGLVEVDGEVVQVESFVPASGVALSRRGAGASSALWRRRTIGRFDGAGRSAFPRASIIRKVNGRCGLSVRRCSG